MNTKYDDDNTRELISLATILDPRFKSNYCTEEDKTTLQEKIIAEGKIVARRIEESAAPGEITLTQASQQDEAVQAPIKKKRKLSDILDQRKTSTSTTRPKSVEQRIQDELSQYLLLPCPEIKSNPLEWWKNHQEHFQVLSTLAKKYLSVCATSCASERVFSTGGNVVTPSRSCLKPEKVD